MLGFTYITLNLTLKFNYRVFYFIVVRLLAVSMSGYYIVLPEGYGMGIRRKRMGTFP